jgi:hypothetical protein
LREASFARIFRCTINADGANLSQNLKRGNILATSGHYDDFGCADLRKVLDIESLTLDDAIRHKLQALVEAGPAQRKSKIETILDPHRDLITAAIAKGHTYRAVTTTLRDAGLNASPETIRRYVQRITKSARPKSNTRRTTTTKTTPTAP